MTEESKLIQNEPTENENLNPAQPQTGHQQELFPDGPLAGLEGPKRWKAILQLAEQAGRRAEEKCRPPLLPLRLYAPWERNPKLTYIEFRGSAAICAQVDRRSRFARWLLKQDRWFYDEYWGVVRGVDGRGHSCDRAVAFAGAFAAVMMEYGIRCVVWEWPD